jgi:hypothetical protein
MGSTIINPLFNDRRKNTNRRRQPSPPRLRANTRSVAGDPVRIAAISAVGFDR